jgi:hypothetical protein
MTYKARLDQLLLMSVQKSNAFIDIVIREGQSTSLEYQKAKDDWEAAENEYVSFLKLIETGSISLGDKYRPGNLSFGLKVKDIAASLFL